jgi:hypothetical protein
MVGMVPRLRTVRAKARTAAVATLAALILSWGIVPASLPVPGVAGPETIRAAISTPYVVEGQTPVAPGVQHDWGTVQTTRSGRQAVHFVQVTAGTPEISFEASLAGDRITRLERTSANALRKSAEGHRVVAAINGDTWAGYDTATRYAPNGVHIQAGELVTAGAVARPTFGIDAEGRPLIGPVLVSAFAVWPDGTSLAVDRVNQKRTNQRLALYTPRFGPTTPTDVDGIDVVLGGLALPLAPSGIYQAVVLEVRAATGGIPIAPDTVVLNGGSASGLATLLVGDPLQLMLSITPGWEGVREAVGGRELIVRDGQRYISPRPTLADQLHPRTAIGITAAGDIVLATVDGRQDNHSTGVDLPELADMMLARGAVQAINMDGGGSTTMAVRLPGDLGVSVVNRPSDGRERAVANSLLLVSSVPTGPLAMIPVTPGSATLWQGEVATFSAKGQDAAYNGVELAVGEVAWGVSGPGTINSAGRYTATGEGDGLVTATARGVVSSVPVRVRVDSFPPVARAPAVALVGGTTLGVRTIPVEVSWPAATDVGRGVVGYELERLAGATWTRMALPKPTSRSISVGLNPGITFQYRVRAVDRAGNVGEWAMGSAFRLAVAQEGSGSIARKGRWVSHVAPQYYGGRLFSATRTGASARIALTATQVAWVAAVGPTRGQARVYVDGAQVRTVDTRSSVSQPRRIVFATGRMSLARHTVEIRVVGTSGRPRVDLDAFVAIVPVP